MTKADTVSLSDSKDWVRMLNGEKDKLFHGYYVSLASKVRCIHPPHHRDDAGP